MENLTINFSFRFSQLRSVWKELLSVTINCIPCAYFFVGSVALPQANADCQRNLCTPFVIPQNNDVVPLLSIDSSADTIFESHRKYQDPYQLIGVKVHFTPKPLQVLSEI